MGHRPGKAREDIGRNGGRAWQPPRASPRGMRMPRTGAARRFASGATSETLPNDEAPITNVDAWQTTHTARASSAPRPTRPNLPSACPKGRGTPRPVVPAPMEPSAKAASLRAKRAYGQKSPMPTTLETERRKPSCPERLGSRSAMASPTRLAEESWCPLLPERATAWETHAMAQALTAETGRPQSSTNPPVTRIDATERTRTPRQSPSRTADTHEATSARWEPDTAARCDIPARENSSERPRALMGGAYPHTQAARSAPESDSPGRSTSRAAHLTRLARSASPSGSSRSVASTTRTDPDRPCAAELLPHSSSALGENLPTQRIRSPMSSSSGEVSQT